MKTRPLWAAGVLALYAMSTLLFAPGPPDDQAWTVDFEGTISNEKSHLCLMAMSDGSAAMAPCDNKREIQLWYVKNEQITAYSLGPLGESLCLRGEDSEGSVYVVPCQENYLSQKWEYVDKQLRSRHSLKCLAITRDDPGSFLTMETCRGT